MAQLDLTLDPARTYQQRLASAEQAAALVRSGDLIWIPSGHATPSILAVLATREAELHDVRIRAVALPNMGWFRPDARRAWNLQVQYAMVDHNRKALAERVIDFHPFTMIQQHKAWDERPDEHAPIDKLLIVTSPPDAGGWVCVGNACWDAVSSARRAKMVIAEESPNLPLTCGDSWLHVSQIDAIVRGHRQPLAAPDPDPTQYSEVDRMLARNLRSLVRDGDTLQIGLGNHTTAVTLLGAFDGANDLGYFGELTVPGTVSLARRGIINCSRTEVHPGRFVACQIGNSPEDLEHIARNPFFELHSYEHTNDPRVISRHDQMLAINGALMVDLSGQIGVYALGPSVYTGLGGQLAFHLGAFMSRRGRAITLLPARTRKGVATIVPQFDQGQIVSIPREIADTIVTDHGIARLLGKSVRERAEQLIHAAHPDDRDWLRAEAKHLYG